MSESQDCTSEVTPFYPSPEPPRAGFERFVERFAAGSRAAAVGFYTIISWFSHPAPPSTPDANLTHPGVARRGTATTGGSI